MGMMRHHDMKLTMGTYTDEAHISFREAIEKLPNILDLTSNSLTHPLTHGSVVFSSNLSHGVAVSESVDESQLPFMQASRRDMPLSVAFRRKGRKAAALGLEPRTPRSRIWCATNCTTRQKKKRTKPTRGYGNVFAHHLER